MKYFGRNKGLRSDFIKMRVCIGWVDVPQCRSYLNNVDSPSFLLHKDFKTCTCNSTDTKSLIFPSNEIKQWGQHCLGSWRRWGWGGGRLKNTKREREFLYFNNESYYIFGRWRQLWQNWKHYHCPVSKLTYTYITNRETERVRVGGKRQREGEHVLEITLGS